MVWVFVFVGIALVGLVVLIAYAVWLAHKAADVMGEVRVLADRGDQLADLLGQIQVSELSSAGLRRHSDLAAVEEFDEVAPT